MAAFKGLHKGELSIFPKEIMLLSPCLWNVPREWYEIKDPEVKYRKVSGASALGS